MKKFEYQQVEYSDYPSPEELNEEGVDGWELVHIYSFKRNFFDMDLEMWVSKEIFKVTFKKEHHGNNLI